MSRERASQAFALILCIFALAGQDVPHFQSTTNLQSIAVQVTDAQGKYVSGLTANDFTLLEDGRPQRIAVFGADHQPVSLTILLDSSASMRSGGKLDRARDMAAKVMQSGDAGDEISLLPFTDRINSPGSGTALYDALATTMCRMKNARNVRQAILVITDGADQSSRLRLEQLIELTQASNPQIFAVGFFEQREWGVYQRREKKVKLLGEREIDNPLLVFDRLAQESGAESFFPVTDNDLQQALDRIASILHAQYTLGYYPQDTAKFRKIEVRVRKSGLKALSRRAVGSEGGDESIHFAALSCEVSAKEHPYPWELRMTTSPSGSLVYREDFSDPRTGWPNREPQFQELKTSNRADGYEITPAAAYIKYPGLSLEDRILAAYGPSWGDCRVSVSVESTWKQPRVPAKGLPPGQRMGNAAGLVFHLSGAGYYVVLISVQPHGGTKAAEIRFKLRRTDFFRGVDDLIPWTPVSLPHATNRHQIAAVYDHGKITVLVDGKDVGHVDDRTLPEGLTGLNLIGEERMVFRDLVVESIP